MVLVNIISHAPHLFPHTGTPVFNIWCKAFSLFSLFLLCANPSLSISISHLSLFTVFHSFLCQLTTLYPYSLFFICAPFFSILALPQPSLLHSVLLSLLVSTTRFSLSLIFLLSYQYMGKTRILFDLLPNSHFKLPVYILTFHFYPLLSHLSILLSFLVVPLKHKHHYFLPVLIVFINPIFRNTWNFHFHCLCLLHLIHFQN